MRRLVLKDPAASGPPLRRGWSVTHVTLLQLGALMLPLLAAFVARGSVILPLGATAIASALIWEALFARLRHRALTFHGLTTGLIVTVMAPAEAQLWQIALAVSFGAVIAELAYGGRGFGFLNAGLASLAFLLFSFPALSLGGDSAAVALAALPGGIALLAAGFISWRVIVAALAGFAATGAALGAQGEPAALAAVLSFPLIFLICDPLASASTNPGRWLYGALAGGLAALFVAARGPENGADALVFAALVAGLFAPLLDETALRLLARIGGLRRG